MKGSGGGAEIPHRKNLRTFVADSSDSDHAGDKPHTMKSHTGSMITLNGTPIQWVSKKQIESTAYSSAMAAIYALSETVRVARSVAWRLDELDIHGTSIPPCCQG